MSVGEIVGAVPAGGKGDLTLTFLLQNTPRAHPKRDAQSVRLKIGLQHVFVVR